MLPANTGSFIARRYMDFPTDEALADHMGQLDYDVTPDQITNYRLRERPNMREPVLSRPGERLKCRKRQAGETDSDILRWGVYKVAGLVGTALLVIGSFNCLGDKSRHEKSTVLYQAENRETPKTSLGLLNQDGVNWGVVKLGERYIELRNRIGDSSSDGPSFSELVLNRAALQRIASGAGHDAEYAASILEDSQ